MADATKISLTYFSASSSAVTQKALELGIITYPALIIEKDVNRIAWYNKDNTVSYIRGSEQIDGVAYNNKTLTFTSAGKAVETVVLDGVTEEEAQAMIDRSLLSSIGDTNSQTVVDYISYVLADYPTQTSLDAFVELKLEEKLEDYVSKDELSDSIMDVVGQQDYATHEEVTEAITRKVGDVGSKSVKEYVDDAIADSTLSITELTGTFQEPLILSELPNGIYTVQGNYYVTPDTTKTFFSDGSRNSIYLVSQTNKKITKITPWYIYQYAWDNDGDYTTARLSISEIETTVNEVVTERLSSDEVTELIESRVNEILDVISEEQIEALFE